MATISTYVDRQHSERSSWNRFRESNLRFRRSPPEKLGIHVHTKDHQWTLSKMAPYTHLQTLARTPSHRSRSPQQADL